MGPSIFIIVSTQDIFTRETILVLVLVLVLVAAFIVGISKVGRKESTKVFTVKVQAINKLFPHKRLFCSLTSKDHTEA